MTNTPRIGKAAKLALAATGSAALLGLVATNTFAAASPHAPSATENTSTPSPADGMSTGPADAGTSSAPADATVSPTPGTATPTAALPGPAREQITHRQATEIAGRRVPGARITEVEREWEHGHRIWKVELVKGGLEYDVYVSAESGTIVRFRQDRDDRGDDGIRDARGIRDDHGARVDPLGDDRAKHDMGDDHGSHGRGHGDDDHGNDRHGDD